MKKALVLLLLLTISSLTFSQQPSRKIVQVVSQQNFFLNGGVRSTFGGKSRTYFEIQLPPNTIEWYYILTTYPSENSTSLNLIPQLTKLFASGGTSILASAILSPTGSNSCDVYLMDRNNADAFMQKADNNGGTFYHILSAKRENFRNGTVQVRDIKQGKWYLGFKNPSEMQGIAVSFEVAAIVEDESSANQQNKAVTYGSLGWTAFEQGEIDRCVELSKKALSLDNTMGWVKANLGLCYLIKLDEAMATEYYVEALTDIKNIKSKSIVRQYLKAVIDDITNAVKKYGDLKGSNYLKSLFEQELIAINN
jgi:hypothetical protein